MRELLFKLGHIPHKRGYTYFSSKISSGSEEMSQNISEDNVLTHNQLILNKTRNLTNRMLKGVLWNDVEC